MLQDACTNAGPICEAFDFRPRATARGECYLYGKALLVSDALRRNSTALAAHRLATTPGLPKEFTFGNKQGFKAAKPGNTDVTQTSERASITCWVKDTQQPPGESAGAAAPAQHCVCVGMGKRVHVRRVCLRVPTQSSAAPPGGGAGVHPALANAVFNFGAGTHYQEARAWGVATGGRG